MIRGGLQMTGAQCLGNGAWSRVLTRTAGYGLMQSRQAGTLSVSSRIRVNTIVYFSQTSAAQAAELLCNIGV